MTRLMAGKADSAQMKAFFLMSKGQHSLKQGDLTKVFKAMARAGVQGRVEITRDGKMMVTVAQAGDTEPKHSSDEWA